MPPHSKPGDGRTFRIAGTILRRLVVELALPLALFVVLWVINTTDLLFAIDSVPAVIGVVKPPDAFIVYSSLAIMQG